MRLASLILAVTALLVTASASATENRWRLEFSGRAETAGTLVFEIRPEAGQGEARQVSVEIRDRLSENRIAKAVTRALAAELGKDYHVERDDGEDVLVKRHHGVANFDVIVVSNTVQGVRINVDRE